MQVPLYVILVALGIGALVSVWRGLVRDSWDRTHILLGAALCIVGALALPVVPREFSPREYDLLNPLPYGFLDTSAFISYLNGLLMVLFIVGAMLAVVRFAIGGIIYSTSDNCVSRSRARRQMWVCLWGLLLLFTSVLILKTANPELVRFTLFDSLKKLVQ